jgi:hypothetical protein
MALILSTGRNRSPRFPGALRVLGEIDGAHAAAGEDPFDAVARHHGARRQHALRRGHPMSESVHRTNISAAGRIVCVARPRRVRVRC